MLNVLLKRRGSIYPDAHLSWLKLNREFNDDCLNRVLAVECDV